MDHMRMHAYKTRANKKHKGQQLLNDFILYSLTTLACTSFCSSPLWYPPFCATFNVFFFFSLPRITSFFFTSKALFIVGNLIVIFLLGESKFFASKSKAYNDVCQLQVISTSEKPEGKTITEEASNHEIQMKILESNPCEQQDEDEFFELYNDDEAYERVVDNNVESSTYEEDLSCSKLESNVEEEEKHGGMEGDMELSLPAEELNKLADDFIARIIRQRRLEAEFCSS